MADITHALRAFPLFVVVLVLAHYSGGPAPTSIPTASNPADGQIAFVSNREGHDDIYLMNSDGSEPQPLTSGGNDNWYPQWSPDGAQLAFSSYTRTDDGTITAVEIHLINADGSGEINLTTHLSDKGRTAFAPVWSPDGERIAFSGNDVHELGYSDNTSNIYLINRDGSTLRQLTQETRGSVGCYSVVWLPDSIHLVATCTALMLDWLVVVDSVDGSQRALLEDAPDPYDAALSQSGEQLGYIGAFGLTFVSLDDPGDSRIIRLPESDYDLIGFTWSPVEESVLVVQTRQALYRMDANTEVIDRLADVQNPMQIGDKYTVYSPPSWSPDGAYVVFVGNDEGNAELYRMEVTNGEILRLTENNAEDYYPVWRPMPH